MRPLTFLALALACLGGLFSPYGDKASAQTASEPTVLGEFGRWNVQRQDVYNGEYCHIYSNHPTRFSILMHTDGKDGTYFVHVEIEDLPSAENQAREDFVKSIFSRPEASIILVRGDAVESYENIALAQRLHIDRDVFAVLGLPGDEIETIHTADVLMVIYEGEVTPSVDLTDSRAAFDLFLACVDGRI